MLLVIGVGSSADMNTECTNAGFDFGIEKFECNSTSPELDNGDYGIDVEWGLDSEDECESISWTSSPGVAGVLSKEDNKPLVLHDGGTSGSFDNSWSYAISHITFCGLDEDPEPSITIVAHKIVCDSEEYLPNWGSVAGQPPIDENTAQDFVDNNSDNCHFEEGWDFQWAFNLSNPGDNIEYAESWNIFGPTNSDGETSVQINNANSGEIHLREALKPGYFPFSDNLQDNVTAEFYCNGDVFNYDNFDFIKDPIENESTFYCVGFNAYLEDEEENESPICNVEHLEKNGEMFELDSAVNYIGEEGYFRTHGSANDSDQGFASSSYPVSVNRTSPGSTNIWSWVVADDVSPNPDWYNVKWYNDFPTSSGRNDYYVSGEHTICCKAVDSLGETFKGGCKDVCIDEIGINMISVTDDFEYDCGGEGRYVNDSGVTYGWTADLENIGCAELDYYNVTVYDDETDKAVASIKTGNLQETFNLDEGEYYAIVFAVDLAGNVGSSVQSEVIIVDLTDPFVAQTGSDPFPWKVWYNSNFDVTEEDWDNYGISGVWYSVDSPGYDPAVLMQPISENETINVLVPEWCNVSGANKCYVTKYIQDYSCRTNEEERQYDIDLIAPNTEKEVGTPRYEGRFFEWLGESFNLDWFIKDTASLHFEGDDFGLSGCDYTEVEIYNASTGILVDSEIIDGCIGSIPMNYADGVYNVTYRSVDNVGNVEDLKWELDKIDNEPPETSMSFTGMVINGTRTIPEFNLPVWMSFIKPSCDNEPIINLTATDSEVGVETTWYQILVPGGDGTHEEWYGTETNKWYEDETVCKDENNENCEETYWALSPSLMKESFTLDDNEDSPIVYVDKSFDGENVIWNIELEDQGEGCSYGHTEFGLVIAYAEDHPVFHISTGQMHGTGSPPVIKEWNNGGWSETMGLYEGIVVDNPDGSGEPGYGDRKFQIKIPKEYLKDNFYWGLSVYGGQTACKNGYQDYPNTWDKWSGAGIYAEDSFCGGSEDSWCEYNEEQGVVFAEECDHKICYYSEDRLGNIEEEGCTVFSIDGEGPLMYLHNPSPIFANSVETCSLNVLVESLDEKVGINEELGIESFLLDGTETLGHSFLIRNPSLDGHGANFSGNMYTGNIDLEGIPAGDYTLRIIAEDKLGNKETIEQPVHLASGIFIDENWSPSCLIGGNGGLCELEFRACVRNSTDMDFSMSKIKPHLANVADLNATLWTEGGWGMVGQLNDTLNGYESLPDQVQLNSGSSCEEKVVNGRITFVVSLNFTKELMETISDLQGDEINNYKFDYEVNSYLDEECLPPQVPQ